MYTDIFGKEYVGTNAGVNSVTTITLPAGGRNLAWLIISVWASYDKDPVTPTELTISDGVTISKSPCVSGGHAPMIHLGYYAPDTEVVLTVPSGGTGVKGYLRASAKLVQVYPE